MNQSKDRFNEEIQAYRRTLHIEKAGVEQARESL